MSTSRTSGPGRLDKILSHALGVPRREAHAMARAGRVLVDGALVTDPGARVDAARQRIEADGRHVPPPGPTLLLLHKPAGVVSATEDDVDRTVLDLVPVDLRRRGLAPVGRLDKDTTGLLLLSDDGELIHALTHPRRHVDKVYEVTFEGALAADAEARVAAGLQLGDGTTCLPARLELAGPGRARMTLHEGKHHQVKRMIAVLGGVVTALHRVAFGPLALPDDLAPGALRPASEDERARVYAGSSKTR